VDDLRNYDAALQYIRGLSFIEAERNLQLYCRSLVCNRPDEVSLATACPACACVCTGGVGVYAVSCLSMFVLF
jgi:hypothetical protein